MFFPHLIIYFFIFCADVKREIFCFWSPFLNYISYSFYNFTSTGGGYMNKIKSRWPTHVSYHYHKIVWIWKQTASNKGKGDDIIKKFY